jgi:hypothetical protein
LEVLAMLGKVKKKLLLEQPSLQQADAPIACPLCARLIPASQRDAHHLIPKSKGGKQTEFLHRICHRQVHALFNETELMRSYNTLEALLSDSEMQRFVAWVKLKPDDFFERTSKSGRLKNK